MTMFDLKLKNLFIKIIFKKLDPLDLELDLEYNEI